MSNQRLILFNPKSVKTTNTARLLGRQLIEEGHITTTDLVHALEQQSKMDAAAGGHIGRQWGPKQPNPA